MPPFPWGCGLAEEVPGLLEKALSDGIDAVVADLGELLEFGTLGGVESGGHFDRDAHVKVAGAVSLNVFYALAPEPEDDAGLSPGGNLDAGFAIERWDFQFGSECGMDEAYRHIAEQVVAVSFEDFMGLYVEDHVKVAPRPAPGAGLAVAG